MYKQLIELCLNLILIVAQISYIIWTIKYISKTNSEIKEMDLKIQKRKNLEEK